MRRKKIQRLQKQRARDPHEEQQKQNKMFKTLCNPKSAKPSNPWGDS